MLADIFFYIGDNVVFIVLMVVLKKLTQLSFKETKPVDNLFHGCLLINGAVAVRIVPENVGYDVFSVLQQGNCQKQDIAGTVQCLNIVSRMGEKQLAEAVKGDAESFRIVFLKGLCQALLKKTDIKGIVGTIVFYIVLKACNRMLRICNLTRLSGTLVGVTDAKGSVYGASDTAAEGNIVVIGQSAADALQNFRQFPVAG